MRARLLYNSSVKPTLTYRAEVWGEEGKNRAVGRAKLAQNKCLRTVNGAFKATSIRELEAEAYISPIDLAMKDQRAAHVRHVFQAPVGEFIRAQCLAIRKRAWRKRRGMKGPAPTRAPVIEEKVEWADERARKLGTGKKAVLSEWRAQWEGALRAR